MKYQLQPEQVVFNNEGLVIKAGWALIYNFNSESGEYRNSTYEYLQDGVGLPAQSCLDAPVDVEDSLAIVRMGDKWAYPADYRGQKIYSTQTGQESIVTHFGDIPDNYTLLAPNTQFDSWDGKQWRLDTNKQHQHDVDMAKAKKEALISEATTKISYLQDAIDAEIATDEETALLADWKKYRVLLNRIDINKAPDIEWPTNP